MFLSARFFVNFARLCLLVLVVLVPAGPAAAHPAPFSYLDITIEDQRLRGEVTVHTIDLAHELQLDAPSNLLDSAVLTQQYSAIKQVLTPRIRLAGAGRAPMALTFTGIEPLVAEDAVRLHFTASEVVAPSLQVIIQNGAVQIPLSDKGLLVILGQMLGNALEHGAHTVTLTAAASPNHLALRIADDGDGVSPGNAARIFDPFFTTKRARGGTGMGLAIVRNVVRLHKGTIALHPQPGGACFQITLPRPSPIDGA